MVDARDLRVTYPGRAQPALRGVDVGIERGERVLVTGASGSGKSTLAICLAGFVPNAVDARVEGSLAVSGMDPRVTSVFAMAQRVGLVQQDPEGQFCTMTVDDEVAFGPENLWLSVGEVERRTARALHIACASHLRGRRLAELSGGEKQRVALASVLAMEPELMILDEPAAYLDPVGARAIVEALQRIDARTTVMILEHKPWRFERFASREIALEEGLLVADGAIGSLSWHARTPADWPSGSRPPARSGCPVLKVHSLSAGYGGEDVIHGVDLQVWPGEIVGLMGDNGCGKTTLLRALMGLVTPSHGQISVLGRDVTSVPTPERAIYMGLVFQNPNHQIFTDSVIREASVGLTARGERECEAERRAIPSLHELGLKGLERAHPLTLSFGQRRRLNLAAVGVLDPEIFLLDEPFAGQDPRRVQDLTESLRSLAADGRAVILVGHDPDIMAWCCHRILFMKNGRTLFDLEPHRAMLELGRRGEFDYLWAQAKA